MNTVDDAVMAMWFAVFALTHPPLKEAAVSVTTYIDGVRSDRSYADLAEDKGIYVRSDIFEYTESGSVKSETHHFVTRPKPPKKVVRVVLDVEPHMTNDALGLLANLDIGIVKINVRSNIYDRNFTVVSKEIVEVPA